MKWSLNRINGVTPLSPTSDLGLPGATSKIIKIDHLFKRSFINFDIDFGSHLEAKLVPKCIKNQSKTLYFLGTGLQSILGAIWEPKSMKNRCKNDPESDAKSNAKTKSRKNRNVHGALARVKKSRLRWVPNPQKNCKNQFKNR
jgi:hypothetical protein